MEHKPEVEAVVDDFFRAFKEWEEYTTTHEVVYIVRPEAQEAFMKMCSSGMFAGAGDEDDMQTDD